MDIVDILSKICTTQHDIVKDNNRRELYNGNNNRSNKKCTMTSYSTTQRKKPRSDREESGETSANTFIMNIHKIKCLDTLT